MTKIREELAYLVPPVLKMCFLFLGATSPLDIRNSLEEQLIQALGLKSDPYTKAWHTIGPLLLAQEITSKREYFRHPAVLIKRCKTYCIENNQDIPNDLKPEHKFFSPFQTLYRDLEDLQARFSSNQVVKTLIMNAIKDNQEYVIEYCKKTGADRLALSEVPISCMTEKECYSISRINAFKIIGKDENGKNIAGQTQGTHRVSGYGGFHFKCLLNNMRESEHPGNEWASFFFYHALGVPLDYITPTFLLTLQSFELPEGEALPHNYQVGGIHDDRAVIENRPGNTRVIQDYYLQVSKTVGKENLQSRLQKDMPRIKADNFGWQLITSLLLRTGDHKADNFMIGGEGENAYLISIDNEECLGPLLKSKELKQSKKTIILPGVKNILFLWGNDLHQPLAKSVRDQLLQISPEMVVFEWLWYLGLCNRCHQNSYVLSNRENIQNELNLPVKISQSIVEDIKDKLERLKQMVAKELTHHDLFRELLPDICGYYARIYERGRGALDDIKRIYDMEENMEDVCLPENEKTIVKTPLDHNLFKKLLESVLDKGSAKDRLKSFQLMVQDEVFAMAICKQNLWPHNLDLWHEAAQHAHDAKVVQFLHRYYPQGKNVKDAKNKMPLDYAVLGSSVELIRDFLKYEVYDLGEISDEMLQKFKQIADSVRDNRIFLDDILNHNQKLKWLYTLEKLFPQVACTNGNTCQEHVVSAQGVHRLLNKDIRRQWDDPNNNRGQNRRVAYLTGGDGLSLYAKFYPELPGIEEAVGELMQQFIGFGAPYGELYRALDGTPVWISQGMPGESLADNTRLDTLDPQDLQRMQIMAMLINPEDGKPANYVVVPIPNSDPVRYRIVGIDNDHAFVPAVIKENPDTNDSKPQVVAQVKTILYCMNNMATAIDPAVAKQFIDLTDDPKGILKAWLQVLQHRHVQYQSLFNGQFEALEKKNSLPLVPFGKEQIKDLYTKIRRLNRLLRGNMHPSPTVFDILDKLEPRLARRYKQVFLIGATPVERFKKADGPFYGKDCATIVTSCDILRSQDIPTKLFMSKQVAEKRHYTPQGALDLLEKEHIAANILCLKDHQSLVEILTSIDNDAKEEQLKELDFSNFNDEQQAAILSLLEGLNWRYLTVKNCKVLSMNHLKKMNLSNTLAIDIRGGNVTQAWVEYLAQNAKELRKLNISGNNQIEAVAKYGWISWGTLEFPNLTDLSTENCTNLSVFNVYAPLLVRFQGQGTKLSLPKNKDFARLWVHTKIMPSVLDENEKDLLRFMKGQLIYTNPDTQEKKVWVFEDLPNPLSGAFDLSECDRGSRCFLSINTGFRTLYHPANEWQVVIWIMPRFWLAAHIGGAASHYKPVLDKWTLQSPQQHPSAGIFIAPEPMCWPGYGRFLTNQEYGELHNSNLRKKFKHRFPSHPWNDSFWGAVKSMRNFIFKIT